MDNILSTAATVFLSRMSATLLPTRMFFAAVGSYVSRKIGSFAAASLLQHWDHSSYLFVLKNERKKSPHTPLYALVAFLPCLWSYKEQDTKWAGGPAYSFFKYTNTRSTLRIWIRIVVL